LKTELKSEKETHFTSSLILIRKQISSYMKKMKTVYRHSKPHITHTKIRRIHMCVYLTQYLFINYCRKIICM